MQMAPEAAVFSSQQRGDARSSTSSRLSAVRGHSRLSQQLPGASDDEPIATSQVLTWLPDGICLSTVEVCLKQTSVGTLICSALRDAFKADCALINAGYFKDDMDLPPRMQSFCYTDLKRLLPRPTNVMVLPLPGYVIDSSVAHACQHALHEPPVPRGSFLQHDGRTIFHADESGYRVRQIMMKPLDPERIYQTVVIARVALEGLDDITPLCSYVQATRSSALSEAIARGSRPAKEVLKEHFGKMESRLDGPSRFPRDSMFASMLYWHPEAGNSPQQPAHGGNSMDDEREQPVFRFGDAVKVKSRSAGGWVSGHIAAPVKEGYLTVEMELNGCMARKHVKGHASIFHNHFPSIDHQRFKLITIGRQGKPETRRCLLEAFDFELAPYGAIVSKDLLEGDFVIEYDGLPSDDVLVRVFVQEQQGHPRHFDTYELVGFIHAARRRQVHRRVIVQARQPVRLGIELHKDLNRDWLEAFTRQDPDRMHSFVECERDDAGLDRSKVLKMPKEQPEDADYILFYTPYWRNGRESELCELASKGVLGPHGKSAITFCTDDSLGFGKRASPNGPLDLYVTNHGFASRLEPCLWSKRYAEAAARTRHGLLFLSRESDDNPGFLRLPACMHWVYEPQNSRIVPLGDSANRNPEEPLHYIASRGSDVPGLVHLSEARAQLNARDAAGLTPLMRAAQCGSTQIIRVLIASRARPDVRSSMGLTALEYAAAEGRHGARLLLAGQAGGTLDSGSELRGYSS